MLGLASSSAANFTLTFALIDEAAPTTYRVPSDSAEDAVWNTPGFDDSGWSSGNLGIGYERSAAGTFDSFIGTDVESSMHNLNPSVYLRASFVAPAASYDTLTLSMRYDDGFIASLNGVLIAQRNAPASPAFNSLSVGSHRDSEAIVLIDFDVSAEIGSLNPGGMNVLSIHGMNASSSNSDFLIDARLSGTGSVPEPSSIGLLAAGLFAVFIRRRR